jgi:hypothetical protein
MTKTIALWILLAPAICWAQGRSRTACTCKRDLPDLPFGAQQELQVTLVVDESRASPPTSCVRC